MDLSFGIENETFRDHVRSFLEREWLPIATTKDAQAHADFRRAATGAGLLYRSVPRVYGGSEQPADVIKANIIREEFARVRAPGELSNPGVKMLCPTLLEHGTEEQKQHFVGKTLLGEYTWCQGYSEPGSGSDLASLKTKAEIDGDEWVIHGQKVWTSRARSADFMFVLARTEADKPKHEGLSYLLLDMRQPGISVRPLRQITGDSTFNEVFFDAVRTPIDWIVGARGAGWRVANTTLKHERNSIGSASTSEDLFDRLVELARRSVKGGKPAIANENIRDRLAGLEGTVLAQKYMAYHQLSMTAAGRDVPMPNLIGKLLGTEIGHEVARIAQSLIGEAALSMPSDDRTGPYKDAKWVNQIFGSLGVSIAGGTSNIQRNLIAERGLGLPREDRAA